ncbi:DUF1570 domain-containing protein [Brevundimonas sp.]
MIGITRTIGLALVAWIVAMAAPAQADWRRAETNHFIVYGDTSEREIATFASRIERFDALLRTYYPIPSSHEVPRLEIYLADGRRDMNRVYPGIGSGVGGYYSSNSGRIYAVVDTQIARGDWVLFHEYAHHFMFQMRANAYPSWFVEGFAEYYSTADLRSPRVQFGRHDPGRMHALNQGANAWAKMEDVLKWRYTPSGRYPAGQYYSQAWAMTHYFLSTPERTRMLGQYLAAVVRGEDSVVAMQSATGRTAAQLQEDIRSYLTGSIQVLTPQIDLPQPQVTVTSLSPAEAAMVWLDIRLDNTSVIVVPVEEDGRTQKSEAQKAREERERIERRADLIQDSLTTAARFPGDRMAMLTIARAQRLSHEPQAALATLEPMLSDESTDADALRQAGMALLDQATSADAETEIDLRQRASGFLARAMDADPLDFRTYFGLHEARRGQDAYPNDNDIATLLATVALAPQAFEGRLRLGDAYMARQMYAQAVQVVTPVANSPHRSSYTRRAREMIAAARLSQGLDVETFEPPPSDEDEPPASSDSSAAQRVTTPS